MKKFLKKIIEYINNPKKRFDVIKHAWYKVNELNSFNSIQNQIKKYWRGTND